MNIESIGQLEEQSEIDCTMHLKDLKRNFIVIVVRRFGVEAERDGGAYFFRCFEMTYCSILRLYFILVSDFGTDEHEDQTTSIQDATTSSS